MIGVCSQKSKALYVAVLLVASSAAGSVFSAPLGGGDGSGADNPDLLRGGYNGACVSSDLCNGTYASAAGPIDPAMENQAASDTYIPVTPITAAAGSQFLSGPADPTGPATDVDWSLSLRGAYENNGSGDHYEALIVPSVSIDHAAKGVDYSFGIDAEIVAPAGNDLRLSRGTVSFESTHALAHTTGLATNIDLDVSQAGADDPNLAAGVSKAPIVASGSAGLAVDRQFGRMNMALRGSIEREIFGDTGLNNGTFQNNETRNRTGLEADLRVTHELTAVLDIFVDGSVQRDIHDLASITTGATQDSTTYAIRGGLTGNWSDRFTAEASAGYARRRFDSDLLGDVPVVLADLTVTYRPTSTLELRAAIATDISAPDPATGSSTRIDYDASFDAVYQANQRLALRTSIAGSWARFAATTQTQTGYSAGVGVDFSLNAHTDLIADYRYGVTRDIVGVVDTSHRVTAGVTYSR